MELLVVLAAVLLLVAMIVPTLQVARENARRAACATQMHGVGSAVTAYAATNEFDLVVDVRAVLYAVDGLDISLKVAREMNKRYKGRKAAKEAAPRKDK